MSSGRAQDPPARFPSDKPVVKLPASESSGGPGRHPSRIRIVRRRVQQAATPRPSPRCGPRTATTSTKPGRTFAGREAIEKEYAALLRRATRACKIRLVIDSLRLLERQRRDRGRPGRARTRARRRAGDQQVHGGPRQGRWQVADVHRPRHARRNALGLPQRRRPGVADRHVDRRGARREDRVGLPLGREQELRRARATPSRMPTARRRRACSSSAGIRKAGTCSRGTSAPTAATPSASGRRAKAAGRPKFAA